MRKLNKPKVAVLMTAYNGENWLREQMDSLLTQEGVVIDVYVSVDLSSDNTFQWLQKLEESNKKVKILPYGVRYGGAAVNFYRLIEYVDVTGYEFVAFADQDDIWNSNKLQLSCKWLSLGNYDAVSSNVIAFWSNGQTKFLNKADRQRKYDFLFEAAGPGCTYVFRVGPYMGFQNFVREIDPKSRNQIMHDWLAYAYFRARGFKWHIAEQPTMLYRQHADNQVGANVGWSAYFTRLKMIREGTFRRKVEIVCALVAPEMQRRIANKWFLISKFKELRRRRRDQWLLLVIILLGLY